jgi:hypothetical protein
MNLEPVVFRFLIHSSLRFTLIRVHRLTRTVSFEGEDKHRGKQRTSRLQETSTKETSNFREIVKRLQKTLIGLR